MSDCPEINIFQTEKFYQLHPRFLTQVQTTKLPGNITVITENIPYVRSFSLGFWFATGTRDETPEMNGISHFIEHMLFKGTDHYTSKKISDIVESSGGYLNAFTTKENISVYGRGLTENLSRTFQVMADMVQFPRFKESDIRKEAGVVLDEIRDLEDNPEELIFDKFEELIYGRHSLAHPILGSEATVSAFNAETVRAYYQKNFLESELLISVSGNVHHQQICELALKYLNRSGSQPRKKLELFSPIPAKVENIEKNTNQIYCILGAPSYGFDSEKRIVLNLLSYLLGDGTSSRLFQAVREKMGIAYQISTFMNTYYDTSCFGVFFSTGAKNLERAKEKIYKEFEKIVNEPLPAKELKRIKEYMKGTILLGLENITNRQIGQATSMLYFNRVIPIDETLERIASITEAELLEVAREILNPEKLFSLTITPAKVKILAA